MSPKHIAPEVPGEPGRFLDRARQVLQLGSAATTDEVVTQSAETDELLARISEITLQTLPKAFAPRDIRVDY